MPTITHDQVDHSIRWVITTLSGILCGFLVSKGVLTADSATALAVLLLSFAPTIGTFVWGFISHSVAGTIASASALPDVHAVVTTSEIAHSPEFVDDDKVVTLAESLSPPKDRGIS